MAHRTILTGRQRAALFDLPTDDADMLRHYILADDDLEHISARRRPENRIGFALQLCALRYPGRLLSSDEAIPEKVLHFIAAQLGLTGDYILPYAARRQTRQQHLHAIRPDLWLQDVLRSGCAVSEGMARARGGNGSFQR